MVDVCVVKNIFRCNAVMFESPRMQEGVFVESVTSAGSVYTLPAQIFFFPMPSHSCPVPCFRPFPFSAPAPIRLPFESIRVL